MEVLFIFRMKFSDDYEPNQIDNYMILVQVFEKLLMGNFDMSWG